MTDKVRLGFIGSGGIVRTHLEHGLRSFPDVEFAAWCDLNPETAAARREQVGGQGAIYTEARQMLDEVKPDAVYIMLPPFAHGPMEALVLDRRLPFFVEKPVAIDLPTALKVADAVAKYGLITGVGYMNRYRKSVQRVMSLLKTQKPVLMHGGWLGSGPSESSAVWGWWTRKDRSGGQFTEQTTHTIDLARYLFGDVVSVYAVPIRDRRQRPPEFTIEDASMVQMTFANGAAANLYSSCSTPIGGGVSLTVWGTGMRAEFTGWEHSVRVQLPDQEQITIPGEQNIFAVEDRAFIDSVRAGKDRGILATYVDGLKATAIACAANDSMVSGQVCKVAV